MKPMNSSELYALSAEDQTKVDLAVETINNQIKAEVDAAVDAMPTTFTVDTAGLSAALGGGAGTVGLSLKVRSALEKSFADNGWDISRNQDGNFVLTAKTAKRKGGGRPRMTDEEKAQAKAAREAAKAAAPAPVVPVADVPVVETPAPVVSEAAADVAALTGDAPVATVVETAPETPAKKGKNKKAA